MIIFDEVDSLAESFTRAAKYEWLDDEIAIFTVGRTLYRAEIKTIERDTRTINVSFVYKKSNGQWSFELKKGESLKEALMVMSTVLAATFERAEEVKPHYITFSAFSDQNESDYNKRLRLYTRMADKYAKLKNYTVNSNNGAFRLKNNADVPKKRLYNDGIQKSDNILYVNFPRCDDFTWATLFGAERAGEFTRLSLPNGRATIKRVNEDKVEIDVVVKGSKTNNLDGVATWMDLLGDITVRTKTGKVMTITDKGAILEGDDVVFCDGSSFYYVESVEDFEELWDYELISID